MHLSIISHVEVFADLPPSRPDTRLDLTNPALRCHLLAPCAHLPSPHYGASTAPEVVALALLTPPGQDWPTDDASALHDWVRGYPGHAPTKAPSRFSARLLHLVPGSITLPALVFCQPAVSDADAKTLADLMPKLTLRFTPYATAGYVIRSGAVASTYISGPSTT